MKKFMTFIPGMALAIGIAAVARILENFENAAGIHIIGASVIALFIGMAVNAFRKPTEATAPGIKFTSKEILSWGNVGDLANCIANK